MDDWTTDRALRVSDAEREHVGGLLAGHLAAGRLTSEEFADRAATAAAAVTRGDLNGVLVDLPGAALPDAVAADVLELRNVAGDLRRTGEWIVPSRIHVRSAFGNARLDLRTARCAAPVVTVDVDLGVGNLDIRLPEGATADLDQARTTIGSVIDRIGPTLTHGAPHIVVRGGTRLGNVLVRH